jgi:cell division protein FtsB
MASRASARRRAFRKPGFRRVLVVVLLVLAALLYYKPLRAYMSTRDTLDQRRAEVRALVAQQRELRHRLAVANSPSALVSEARRLGYVKPGERLYIVKGIEAWRHRHRATIQGRG